MTADADGPRDADQSTLKSYQLLHATQLLPIEYAMFVLQSTDSYHKLSKLYAVSTAVTVDCSREAALQV